MSERKVWVISCTCGWSRMVPRSTPAARRRALIEKHRTDDHLRPDGDD